MPFIPFNEKPKDLGLFTFRIPKSSLKHLKQLLDPHLTCETSSLLPQTLINTQHHPPKKMCGKSRHHAVTTAALTALTTNVTTATKTYYNPSILRCPGCNRKKWHKRSCALRNPLVYAQVKNSLAAPQFAPVAATAAGVGRGNVQETAGWTGGLEPLAYEDVGGEAAGEKAGLLKG